jgi:RimJ/RimL family protein N-acetyltransferase
MIEAREYRKGDGAAIPVAEQDPHDNWLQQMESGMHGLTSYERDGKLVAVSGYELMWQGVAWAFALVDREACAGAGPELARAVRASIGKLVLADNLHRVQACCDPNDPATKVFLRAIGFRLEATMRKASPFGGDLLMMAMVRGVHYEQGG